MNKIKMNIRLSELDTLSAAIVRQFEASLAESETLSKDANLSSMMAEVKALSSALTLAIKSDRAESSLDEADIARDAVIRDLSNVLSGYASLPMQEKRDAAKRLLTIFRKYGRGITVKNYAEESSLIESLLGDFSAETAKADAASLEGVGELIASLRSAEEEFKRQSDALTVAKSAKTESASVLKKKLQPLLNTRLVPYLSALENMPGYADFISRAEVEIDKANGVVSGRGKNAPAEPADTKALEANPGKV